MLFQHVLFAVLTELHYSQASMCLLHGIFYSDKPLREGITSIARVYSNAGYSTAYIGKWHVDGHGRSAFIPPERRQGFEFWRVMECTHDYNNSQYYGDKITIRC